ncbi:MAG: hypothetical protein JNK12_21255 [Acidimicrobiales bacterium]|nr:hypothetical protein [Acidimicrobiales bacterium]
MIFAAFFISLFALCVAVASASYTYRQAVATEDLSSIDSDRRHDERTPVVEVRRLSRAQDGNERLEFRLVSGPTLTNLEATIVVDAHDTPPILGMLFAGGDGFVRSGPVAPFEVGHREVLTGLRDPSSNSELLRLQLVAYAGDERWTLAAEVEYPSSGRRGGLVSRGPR